MGLYRHEPAVQEFQSGWCIGTVKAGEWEDHYMQTLFTIDPCEACEGASILPCTTSRHHSPRFATLRSLIAWLFRPDKDAMLVSKIKPCLSKYKPIYMVNTRPVTEAITFQTSNILTGTLFARTVVICGILTYKRYDRLKQRTHGRSRRGE